MLSKRALSVVEHELLAAPRYGVDPSTTRIPAVEWVCRRCERNARLWAFRRTGGLSEAGTQVDPAPEYEHREMRRHERLWLKWAAEVRANGIPAELLAKYSWRA